MKCAHCKNTINATELKVATLIHENGKLKSALHRKCAGIVRRRATLVQQGRTNTPTAYDQRASKVTADDLTAEAKARREKAERELVNLQTAKAHLITTEALADEDGRIHLDELISAQQVELSLASRQEEIAAEREKEEVPKGWADTRDPAEGEI